MKKEIIVCDKCDREIHKGEQYVQRPKDLHSSKVSDMQDICMICYTIYPVTVATDEYKPLFWKAANREFWHIL